MEKIQQQLESVKSELESTDLEADVTAQGLLEVINPALENPGELSFKHHRQLVDRFKQSVETFEATHPRLFDEIRLIIQSLNETGI